MTVTATPVFPQALRLVSSAVSAANSTYSGTTIANAVLLDTAGSNGSEYTHVGVIPTATQTTANQIQLFANDGTNFHLISTVVIPSYTVATTTQMVAQPLAHCDGTAISEVNPLRLQSGWKLYAGIAVAQAVSVTAQVRDY